MRVHPVQLQPLHIAPVEALRPLQRREVHRLERGVVLHLARKARMSMPYARARVISRSHERGRAHVDPALDESERGKFERGEPVVMLYLSYAGAA